MPPYNTNRRKQNKPQHQAVLQNEHIAPTGGNTYQPPEFDFEEYGALKQRVKVIEERTKNHSNSINAIENQRSWIKGAAWGIGGLLILLISCFGWFISTFKESLSFALTEDIRQLIDK